MALRKAASSTDADVGGRSLSTECLGFELNMPELSVDRPNRSDRGARLKLALLRLAVFIVCTTPDDAVDCLFLWNTRGSLRLVKRDVLAIRNDVPSSSCGDWSNELNHSRACPLKCPRLFVGVP